MGREKFSLKTTPAVVVRLENYLDKITRRRIRRGKTSSRAAILSSFVKLEGPLHGRLLEETEEKILSFLEERGREGDLEAIQLKNIYVKWRADVRGELTHAP